jgi:hypothetical protein
MPKNNAKEVTMNILRSALTLTACCALGLGFVGARTAAEDPRGASPAKNQKPSLDDQLLEGLDNALLEGLDDATSKKAQSKVKQNEKANSLDDQLLDDLDNKDDRPDGKADDPLVGIERRMKTVAARLADEQLDDQTTDLQKRILDDLAALLQECKKQCQGGGSGKPGSKPGKGGQGSQAGKSPATQAPSDTARDSSDKLRNRATERPDKGALVNAMKESWGNLPQRLRQELSNSNTDAFLPKYEMMLEKYFKRLAEAESNE